MYGNQFYFTHISSVNSLHTPYIPTPGLGLQPLQSLWATCTALTLSLISSSPHVLFSHGMLAVLFLGSNFYFSMFLLFQSSYIAHEKSNKGTWAINEFRTLQKWKKWSWTITYCIFCSSRKKKKKKKATQGQALDLPTKTGVKMSEFDVRVLGFDFQLQLLIPAFSQGTPLETVNDLLSWGHCQQCWRLRLDSQLLLA